MDRKIILGIAFILLMSYGYAQEYIQITEFDGGDAKFNMTGNTTKTITIGKNVSIINATISLRGYRYITNYSTFNFSTTQGSDGTTTPSSVTTNGTYFWVTNSYTNEIDRYLMNGTWDSEISLFDATGITNNGTHIWVSASADKRIRRYLMDFTYDNYQVNLSVYSGDMTNNGTHIFILLTSNDINVYDMDTGAYVETYNTALSGIEGSGIAWTARGFYLTNPTTDKIYLFDHNFNYLNKYIDTISDSTNMYYGMDSNGTHLWATDLGAGNTDAVYEYELNYPENIIIKLNSTTTWSHTGELSGSNLTLDLNATYMQTFLQSDNELPITIGGTAFGELDVFNLSIFYDDVWICNSTNGGTQAFNFTIRNEDNSSTLTGDIYVDITYGNNNLSFQEENVSSVAICIGGQNNYTVSGTIISDVSFTHKYFMTNVLMDNITNYIYLYNYLDDVDKSTLEYYIKDNTWTAYGGLYNKMQRYYPDDHAWKTVQQDESGEFGRTIFHVREQDTDYRFSIYDGNTLLHSTDLVKFVCTDDLCQVTSQVTPSDADEVDIGADWTYNNDTGILQVTWNDVTASTSSVTILLYKETLTGSQIICNYTAYTYAGTYNCNASGYTGTGVLTIKSQSSPETIKENAFINLGGARMFNFLTLAQQGFWTFGISLTIAMAGLVGSPVAVIGMFIFGLWILSMLGMMALITVSFLGIAMVIGFIVSKLTRKK